MGGRDILCECISSTRARITGRQYLEMQEVNTMEIETVLILWKGKMTNKTLKRVSNTQTLLSTILKSVKYKHMI